MPVTEGTQAKRIAADRERYVAPGVTTPRLVVAEAEGARILDVDGRSFIVTQSMTSLTGSAGEDFASILRALGYRMDKRPPLPPKPAPEAVVETVS